MSRGLIHFGLKLLLTVTILLGVCGCWDNKDINHRALPVVMGLDHQNGAYKVYLLIPHTTQRRTDVRIVTQEGSTINQVVDKIAKDLEVDVDLLHLKVLVFHRAVAEAGMKDSISSFMRARDISPKTIVAISDDKLETLFQKLKTSSTSGGMEMYNFFQKHAGWSPNVAQTRVWEIYRSLDSFTRDVAVPLIKAGQTTPIESTGSAVIKNGMMVGRITPDETLLFNSFNGLAAQGKIEVMDRASVMILTENLTHSSSFNDGKPVLNSRLTLKVTILETKGSPTEAMIKQDTESLLTDRFGRMLRKIQSEEADILGLGQLFRTKIPRDRLTSWRTDYYPTMKVNFQVNTIIQNEGLLKMKNK